jgi:SAM-dependent methyltransferase
MKISPPYKTLCTEYYELDKPFIPQDALDYYLYHARQTNGPLLEPMCGTGRFLIPIAKAGFQITGFDTSQQMLEVCLSKCQSQNIPFQLFKTNFEKFQPTSSYDLIFIPSGSFCLLTDLKEANTGLDLIYKWLKVEEVIFKH